MATTSLDDTARALVSDGKGLLAADETVSTLTKRLAARSVPSSHESRRDYRELFFTTPGISQFISGVILQDETIRQFSASGPSLVEVLTRQGIIPGIKVDGGAKPLAGHPQERITEGLDGLRGRLEEYAKLGARFAKWRAVIVIIDTAPTRTCIETNAYALAQYAALCQEQGLVPIVEPEVLMDGGHPIERCAEVTERVLETVFDALFAHRVRLEGMLLKPNMVTAGQRYPRQPGVSDVARATLLALDRHVPPAVPGVVFLSGGQDAVLATQHLNAINQLEGPKPWKLSFSYGRALQDEALSMWRGRGENVPAAQRTFFHRARCVSAAALGRYGSDLEGESVAA